MTTILGIETSCDETSVAIVEDGHRVRCNLIATQVDLHAKYGGVVPEIASRAHIETLDALIYETLDRLVRPAPDDAPVTPGEDSAVDASGLSSAEDPGCGRDLGEIDAIAVTCRPGLIGSLLIGVTAAKTLAWCRSLPLVAVNHVHAHATSAAIDLDDDPWPAVALVVSGGHTSLYHVRDYDQIDSLGRTTDDAAGEAFDKTANILNLGYPGGPVIDRRARAGNARAIRFPRTMLKSGSLDFSFSGLKTAVLYHVHGVGKTTGGLARLRDGDIDDICASFSAAVVDVLVRKTLLAVARTGVSTVVVGGGVAANSRLRSEMAKACAARGLTLHLTPEAYCTDNAAMIAALGFHRFRRSDCAGLDLVAAAGSGP
ncbi:MAG: tRNA (adenosine(37)-N6)-threonylcarbamoyltransferase complex transferase subunit TsaD [Phycisphaerae bacterium]